MRLAIVTAALLGLAGCGVEGPPESVPGGVSISGGATIGVRGSL